MSFRNGFWNPRRYTYNYVGEDGFSKVAPGTPAHSRISQSRCLPSHTDFCNICEEERRNNDVDCYNCSSVSLDFDDICEEFDDE
eukprot:Awhi_evm1s875